MMTKRASVTKFLFVILLGLCATLIITTKVSGSAACEDNREEAKQFCAQATEFIRGSMADKYYSNCGVTISSVYEANVVEAFHINIHHQRFEKLDDVTRQVLCASLSAELSDQWNRCVQAEGSATEGSLTKEAPQIYVNLE